MHLYTDPCALVWTGQQDAVKMILVSLYCNRVNSQTREHQEFKIYEKRFTTAICVGVPEFRVYSANLSFSDILKNWIYM